MTLENIKRITIDNHFIDMFKLDDIITIYFQYNNNCSCSTMYYNLSTNNFTCTNNLLTNRQKTILEKFILENYKI